MKQKLISQTIFVTKSLLWSVLFFIATMAILNWEEFSSAAKKGEGPKSWVIKEHGEVKELIPVKVGVSSKLSPIIEIFKSINECF